MKSRDRKGAPTGQEEAILLSAKDGLCKQGKIVLGETMQAGAGGIINKHMGYLELN